MKLTIPAQQPYPDPSLETRVRPLSQWLESLPYLDAGKTIAQLREYLHKLNRQPLEPQQRLEVLDAVSRSYWRLWEPAVAVSETLPGASSRDAVAQQLQRLCQDLGFGYKVAVHDALGSQRRPARNRVLHMAVLETVQCLGQHMLHRYAAYQRAPQSLWNEVDQLYRYAVQHQFHREKLTGQLGKSTSIEQAFMATALLRVGDPYRLECGMIWEISRYVREHAREADLLRWEEDMEEQPGRFYLKASNLKVDGIRHGLCLDVRALQQQGERDLHDLRAGEPAADLGFGHHVTQPAAIKALERLVKGWEQRRPRNAAREALPADAEVAVGLETAFFFLNRGLAFDRHGYLDPNEENEFDLGADALQWDPTREVVYRTLPCRTVNRSAGGVAVRCFQPRFKAPRVGQVILVRTKPRGEEMADPWFVATARWLAQGDGDDFELGAQYLAREAVPVAVRPMIHERAAGEFQAALRTTMRQANHTWRILITPTGLFQPSRYIEVVHGGQRERVRCEKLLETGWGFERFSYRLPE